MKDYKIQMKFLTFIIVMVSIVMLSGCEKQAEHDPFPIEKVLLMPDPENPQFSQPCQEDSDYECGVILVKYDEETWAQHKSPIPTVNQFLVEKGYKPEVTGIFDFIRTEVIYVGEFDVLPMIKKLEEVSGVEYAEPNYFVSIDNPALEGN
jgi:hypothetical protein